MASTRVFVSYSRPDERLVGPVVRLLRANAASVFQDTDSMLPGKEWRPQLEAALEDADTVIVFWCDHARSSSEVAKEWQAAISQNKDILPLLLDGTPLPEEISKFQWIDFTEIVGPGHSRTWLSKLIVSKSFVAGAIAMFFVASIALKGWIEDDQPQISGAPVGSTAVHAPVGHPGAPAGEPAPQFKPQEDPRRQIQVPPLPPEPAAKPKAKVIPPPPPPPPPPSMMDEFISEGPLVVGAVLVVAFLIFTRRLWRRGDRKVNHIAGEIEAELLRRASNVRNER